MKPLQLFMLVLALTGVTLANAQWNTSGNDINNTNTGVVMLGSSTPVGTNKLQVTGNATVTGQVGIGTNSPGTRLDIGIGSTTETGVRITMLSSQTADAFQVYDAAASKAFAVTKDGFISVLKPGSTYPSTPAAVLDLQAQGSDYIRAYNTGTGGIVFKITDQGSLWNNGWNLFDAGNTRINTNTLVAADWSILPSISASTGTADLRLNRDGFSGGNVLVGFDATQGSGFRLQVKGKTYMNDALCIGTTTVPTGYKLAVVGNIIAEKVKVKLASSGWPDYVFGPGYELLSLKEVEAYIKRNNHLPGVPSAEEIGKDGLDLGDGQAVLLKKIEELTLHLIELDKRIEKLEAENTLLKKKN